jgi:flavin-dependent dehydrogenase
MRPVVIAGGGPAGAAAAALLARGGRRVVVVEREAGPAHKVCGEFLGGPALAALARVGIDVGKLGASPIDRVRVVRGSRVVEAPLGFAAAGLSRYAMDEALLAQAAAEGAEIVRGKTIRATTDNSVDVDDAGQIEGAALLLATGKHELRGAKRALARPAEDLVGFKTHLRLTPQQTAALQGAIELILFADGYAGLQMIEGGKANLCLLASRKRFIAAGATWDGLQTDLLADSPHLRTRLQGATAWPKPLAIARVPYGYVYQGQDTAFRLGDQMGVIPSLAGEGMAIALHSAAMAARCVLEGGAAASYHAQMRRDVTRPIRVASALYRVGRVPVGQRIMMTALRAWPRALSTLAAATRTGPPRPRAGVEQ